MLKTKSLHFAYNPHQKFHFPDFELRHKENMLILGESGIGKTTLLHLLAGLLAPASGTVQLDGTDFSGLSSGKLDRFRGNHIGIVFQRPRFIQALTLEENLYLAQYLANKKRDDNRLSEVLKRLGIARHRKARAHRLSQGEQQRAAIALALINHPSLILADEPTSSLDDKNCSAVSELLLEQAEATAAMLVVITHDQRLKEIFHNTLELSGYNTHAPLQQAS
ncbi:ABC transporter ATP-binding protein [Fulvivirga kasyanovii]|uniref:ATP-binding cassette domain-containing protein n=1 Tax=Fulvivirga kasyanovii TaxID=396812 RepID=A0ABW9RJ17_9BACT|nr:ATP-binding cassette domain-containing protein [Fulvivirga kasyanovii]MTI24054.1 ATP-binding cassette domain-containing protein [Fulvivirga kasyanovii]